MGIVEITAMTFGPYGIGHLDGKSIMVPNSAPGDVLEVAVESERAGYSIARIDRVIESSSSRRTPPCPFLPRCGGCDWQQINYADQVRLKGETIARELHHALGVELDAVNLVEPSPAEFGYRTRVRLKVARDGAVGFHELGTNRLVAIDRCLVADCDIAPAARFARAFSRDLLEIEVVRKSEAMQVLVGYLKKPPIDRQIGRARRFIESEPSVAGIVLRAGESRSVIGDAAVEMEVEAGISLQSDADLFGQVNRGQNQKLVAEVMDTAKPGPSLLMIDLFCGSGNFSLPAARRGARVIGVDSDGAAIAAASANAVRLGLADAQFVAMNAHDLAAFFHRSRSRPDIVVLDPPRTGAADLIEPVVRLRPARVVYVSCDVATLARDLRALDAGKYRIERVRGFDFFPNTHHVEIVACSVLT